MKQVDVLGAQEYGSTARGLKALDAMVKAAPVSVLSVQTINPGRYVVFITGDVASVEVSLAAGKRSADGVVLDELFIKNMHPYVIPALSSSASIEAGKDGDWDAIGIIETTTIIAGVYAADAAAKKADVRISAIRLDSHMGGRASVKLMGELGEVEAAVEAGSEEAARRGALLTSVIIPRPHPDIAPYLRD